MNRRTTHFLVLLLIAAGLLAGWWGGHSQDDAFITFRYSRHLVEGLGPVFNPGERVEGYSNFLWMLLMAVPIGLGMDPETPSWLLGLACLGLNWWLCFRLFSRVLRCHRRGFLVFCLLVTHNAMIGFGTSGLETAMNGLLWTWLLWITVGLLGRAPSETRVQRWMAAGLAAALCLLSRPDGAVVVMVCGGFLIHHLLHNKQLTIKYLTTSISTFFVLIIPWLAWKWSYYGGLLPNTFYAKGGGLYVRDGLLYVGLFILSYGLLLPGTLMLVRAGKFLRGMPRTVVMLWVLVLAWTGYLVLIGGDFMFFRMWVPVLPAIYLAIGAFLFRVERVRWLRYGVLALLLLANLLHPLGFGHWYAGGFVLPLERWTNHSGQWLSYREQGQALGKLFAEARPAVRIAEGAAGAIPYYSGLHTTDLYGLTDPGIARHGARINLAPGHRRLATMAQLEERGVHLWIYRCERADHLSDLSDVFLNDPALPAMRPGEVFPGGRMRVLRIPMPEGFALQCIYLVPHPLIDAQIQSGDFQYLEVFFRGG